MKYSQHKIEFHHTLIYKDKNNNIETTLYKKPTDRQNYIHSKSDHPFLYWKKSIAYSQALRLNNWGTWKTYRKLEKATNKERLSRNYGQWRNSKSNQPRQNRTFESGENRNRKSPHPMLKLQQNFTQYQNNNRKTLTHIECQSWTFKKVFEN